MNTTGLARGLCVAALAFDAVLYSWWIGFWPGVGWIVAAVAVSKLPAGD